MSGTSMSTPEVAGAAALLLEANPNLTPGMVRMILQYSAQPLAGADMLEQGAGELNIEGAVRIVNSLRTDIDFDEASFGSWMKAAGSSTVVPNSLIAGTKFNWAQIVTSGQAFISGTELITEFQNVYRTEN